MGSNKKSYDTSTEYLAHTLPVNFIQYPMDSADFPYLGVDLDPNYDYQDHVPQQTSSSTTSHKRMRSDVEEMPNKSAKLMDWEYVEYLEAQIAELHEFVLSENLLLSTKGNRQSNSEVSLTIFRNANLNPSASRVQSRHSKNAGSLHPQIHRRCCREAS